MKKQKIKRNIKSINKGITLISLVVTIIILLILIGISVSVLTGNEGVISKTVSIGESQKVASEMEILDQDLMNVRNKNIGKVPIDKLETEFKNNNIIDENKEDSTEQLDLNGDLKNDAVLVKTKNGNEFIYDGETIISCYLNSENKYKYYDENYTIKLKDETINKSLNETIECRYYRNINLNIDKNYYTFGTIQKNEIDKKSYIFMGWKDSKGKQYKELYSKTRKNGENEIVTLTANWVETICTVKVAVLTENIDNNEYTQYTDNFNWYFSNTITINNENLLNNVELKDKILETIGQTKYDLDADNVEIVGSEVVITQNDINKSKNKELTIKISRNRYNLTIGKENGINTFTGGGSYKADQTVTISATLNRGYKFKEWTSSTSTLIVNKNQPNTKITMPASDATVKATAETIKYTIAYNGLEGASIKNNPTSYNIETEIFLLNNPTKTGYSFTGWTGSNGTIPQKSVTIEKGSTENKTYTANWTPIKYVVEYDGNGKTGGSTANSNHTYNESNVLTTNGYTREHTVTYNHNYEGSTNINKKATYTFKEWNTRKDGSGTVYANNATVTNLSDEEGATINLYAQWNSSSVTYIPTREGYTFDGWYVEKECITKATENDGIYTPKENKTLYAKWTINQYYIDLNHTVDTIGYASGGYNGRIKTGLKIGGVDKGYVLGYYTQHDYGTEYEIYGLQLDGVNVPYTQKGTLGAKNLDLRIYFYTLEIEVDNSEYGTVSKNDIIVPNNQTTFTTSGNKLSLSDGREITATVTNKTGYTTQISSWSSSNGTIATKTTITANFTRIVNNYNITYDTNYYENSIWKSTKSTSKYLHASTTVSSKTLANDSEVGNNVVKITMNQGTSGGPYYSTDESERLTPGKTYTWSVYLKTSSEKNLNIGSEQNGRSNITATTEWQKITYTFVANDNTYDAFVIYLRGDSTWNAGDEVYIHSLEIMEGTPQHNIQSKEYDTKLGTLPTLTREGYTFNGWYTEPIGGNSISADTTVPPENTTYYAKWTANTYTVTYNYAENGGKSATKTTANTKYDDEIDLTPTATKDGWTFVGWNTNKDATAKLSSIKTGAENVTLYAIYSKKLIATCYTYNNVPTLKETIIYNKATKGEVDLPSIDNKTINNVTYTGRGWSTSNAANAENLITSGGKDTLSCNTTYFASYQSTITATFNYCTLAANAYTYTKASQASITASAIKYMGYKGDYIESNYTVPQVVTSSTGGASAEKYIGVAVSINSAEITTPTTANTTYYAVYTEDLTFYYYNGTENTSKKVVRRMLSNGETYSNSLSDTAPVPSEYNNNSFKYWSYDMNQYESSYSRIPLGTGANNLYAVYSKEISVTYNGNGGLDAPAISKETAYYIFKNGGITPLNLSITLSTTEPTKTGYIFTSWNAKVDGTGTSYDKGTAHTFSSNITLYAMWQANTYTVTYNANGGTCTTTNKQVTYDSTYGELPTPIREGYIFNGWYTASSGGTKITADSVVNIADEQTLYAQWTINASKLTINPNGGSVSVASPAGGTSETISTSKTYTQNYNTTLTYGAPTKADSTATSTYTVTYNYNGSGAANTTATTTKTAVVGYTFSEWTKSPTFYGTLSSTTGSGTYTYPSKNNETSTITAEFTSSQKSSSTIPVTLPTPTRTGYCFAGWYKEAAGTNKVGDAGGSYIPTANITLYAKWIQANGIIPVVKCMNISSINAYTGTSISENTTISTTYSTTNTLTVNGISYAVRIYRFSNNITINSGCTMTLGSSDDVGTASTNATRMVIAVFEGNLTNNGTITAYNTAYGGPKGMYICCKGTLTNNGTITMTARGAKAAGENVYLYSPDTSWATSEYVPAAGGTGRGGVSVSSSGSFGGYAGNGTAGTGRQTGRRCWWRTWNW